ncbi:MAG: threonylcarbamoyl-AMP synthase [Rickettsiales bacterium]|nr:threonylcarbamoyl-AMP synthase [Rickettsiales bacterium]
MIKIIKILESGGVAAIPTDTVYGLMGDPTSPDAVEKVCEIKNRRRDRELSILVRSIEDMKDICKTTPTVEYFIKNKLENNTIILEKKDERRFGLISRKTIGMRIPNDAFLLELLRLRGAPLFATSVNISGQREYLLYEDIVRDFGDRIDIIVKNNIKSTNKPSDIFKAEGEKIIKIRGN